MRSRIFLSLPLGPWGVSLMAHLLFFAILLFVGRTQTLDLSVFQLDLSGANSPVALAAPVPEDELWQKPFFKHHPPPPQFPEKKPVPPPSLSPGPSDLGTGSGPYRSIAEVSRLPHFINQVKALYPDAAKRANIEGVVILQVDIDATGAVKMVQLVQGLGYGCDEAALAAAQQSTFSPAYAGEEPVPVRLRIPYRFKFDQ